LDKRIQLFSENKIFPHYNSLKNIISPTFFYKPFILLRRFLEGVIGILLGGRLRRPWGPSAPSDVKWEMSGILGYEYIWCIIVKIVVKDYVSPIARRRSV
jgi:hypothetical protein